MTGLWREFLRTYRPWIRGVSIVLTVFAVIMVGVVAVTGVAAFQKAKEASQPVNSATMPIENLTAGMVDVGGCVRSGPEACTDYDKAIRFVAMMAPSLSVTAPGETATTVKLGKDTTRDDWVLIGDLLTFNGKASSANVTEKTVTKAGEGTANVPIDGATGTFQYAIISNMMVLTSVTWKVT